jgi:hypothetical protein
MRRLQEGLTKGQEERQVYKTKQKQQREKEERQWSRRLFAESDAHQRVGQVALVHAVEREHATKRWNERVRFP